jgi:dephospho-CoA kinase
VVKKKKIIGVTGGLATGKSTVTDLFAALGAVRVDADAISHDILENDEKVKTRVKELFGEGILTGGRIDRKKLARAVFFDKDELGRLCEVMHPVIIERIRREVAHAGDNVVVIDAPLLVEAGMAGEVDVLVVVTADADTQIDRAVRRGMEREEAARVIDSQMPLSQKAEQADHIICNEGEIEKIKEGVDRIWQKI